MDLYPSSFAYISSVVGSSMDVKTFRVNGMINRSGFSMAFSKEVRALRAEDAVERVYANLGSQHRAKRFNIKIASVSEVSPEDTAK